MEFTTNEPCNTPAIWSILATLFSKLECLIHVVNFNVREKSPSFETALPEPADTTSKETAPSLTERWKAVHTFTKTNEDDTGSIEDSDSVSTDWKLQTKSKSVLKMASDTRCKIESAMADLGVGTKIEVEATVKCGLTKLTNTLQLHIARAVKPKSGEIIITGKLLQVEQ